MLNDGIESLLVEETDQDSHDVLCKDVVSGWYSILLLSIILASLGLFFDII